jgi:iron-sulfur cluster repair protein YtfE (RIC family)
MDAQETEIEKLPDSLIHEPLNWLFAEHYRHRQLCRLIDSLATAAAYNEEGMNEVIAFLEHDLPLHVLDEEEDLFPLLRRRAVPDDDLEHVLGVLSGEHQSDGDRVSTLLAALIRARSERKSPALNAGLRTLLTEFAVHERKHIALENAVILPIARLRLQACDLQALSARLAARRGRLLDGVKE